MELIQQLKWRYATKRMTGAKVEQAKIDTILEAIKLSASSYGLQPYNVIVIENEAVRKQIQPAAYNQPQIAECSHLLVFAAWDGVTQENIDEYINLIATTRGMAVEQLDGMKGMLVGAILSRSKEDQYNWAARQAYIALGTGLIAAASEGVDATPMEGFNPAGVDEILGLKEKGLRSVALLALGHRDEANDYLAKAIKVRRPDSEFFING